jgi:hypothetical protein
MEMVVAMKLNLENRLYGCGFKPGELLERQEKFLTAYEQPKAMLGDVGDFRL